MAASRCVSHALHYPLLPSRSPSSPLSLQSGAWKSSQCKQVSRRTPLPSLRIVAQKSPDLYKAFAVAVKTARDALDAGTKLVPESVPRPVAQAGVAILGIVGSLYLLQSLFSIALFILAIGGVGYYLFYSLNKDDDDRGGGNSSNGSDPDLTLEEARRIMEKYNSKVQNEESKTKTVVTIPCIATQEISGCRVAKIERLSLLASDLGDIR
ncbi:hypothetical protein GOP47_0013467 [Adiantum capillus-veneris]|uniref:Uncharacterized protein n=1 Tax=Adiantum capillus-veneris TaxID=13818 RepID=A0A9D4ZFT1_ADICA|nr:hypothetical protein GOP47_0013467 [Adiantum capillus-veneris]